MNLLQTLKDIAPECRGENEVIYLSSFILFLTFQILFSRNLCIRQLMETVGLGTAGGGFASGNSPK